MKHILKKTSPTQVHLTITLDAKDLASVRPLTITKLSKNVKVAGFRAGKVPANVAEKNIDPTALESQVVEDAINKYTIVVLEATQLNALARPQVDVKSFDPGKVLEYTAEIEILPEVKLGDYKKLKAPKMDLTIKDSDIDEIIERMRQGFSEKKDMTRAAKNGDEVTIDFTGKKDDVAFDGGAAKDYLLVLGSNSFIPGFEEAIVGHSVNEEFPIDITFPDDYHAKDLKGQKVVFDITLKAIKEVVLPSIDDAFAEKCGPFKTVKELKADISRELTAQKQQTELDKVKDALIEQLVEKSDVPTPESIVEDQMRSIEQDTIQNLLYRGQSIEQFLESQSMNREQWLAKDVRPAAEKRVKVGLLLAELSKAEKINVSEEELAVRHSQNADQYTDPKLKEQFNSPEERRNLANRLLTEKTVDRIVELNTKQ